VRLQPEGNRRAPLRRRRLWTRDLLALAMLVSMAWPAWPQDKPVDLTDRSLEDLMNIEVTSVSKKEQKLSHTASAIFVITAEDIRRSGATKIPDLLRMVPGMDVAQLNANTWAISARGLNGRFSNELMVMLDGRPVYSPTFGGVFWDVLDLPLENIERIEVIRGPGGSIWGANAVNGVVNIITKKAGETRGAMVVAGAGNEEPGFGTTQYGGALGRNTDYRVYSKYLNDGNLPSPTGNTGEDGWHVLRGGFRLDSAVTSRDTVTVQGDLYTGEEGNAALFLPSVTSPALVNVNQQVDLSGGFLQSVWNHEYSGGSDSSLQISYDRYTRNDVLNETRYTLDVDFQHHFAWGERQDFVWGLGYRYSGSKTNGGFSVSLDPANLDTQLSNSFIQDEITIVPDRLYLTVGAKLEHNYYTGFDFLPTIRAAWTPDQSHMFWAAVSRATRIPASTDTAIRVSAAPFTGPGGIPGIIQITGNPAFKDEGLLAYEAGYRTTIRRYLSLDFAAYYNGYDHQETSEPSAPFLENTPAPPHLVLPLIYENLMHGEAHGFEVFANWKLDGRWTLSPGYAFEQIHMHLDPTSHDTGSVADAQGSSPVHSAEIRSHLVLPRHLEWEVSGQFVDRLRSMAIPSYTRVDTQLIWPWTERISFALVGQNLVKNVHQEFEDITNSSNPTLIKRSAYAKITARF
jgi:iron complex outermembrane receptor protein